MHDEQVLDAVRHTLADVEMDRPLEAIQQRGRAHRRNRRLLATAAGGGVAAVAALALALPMLGHRAGGDPAAGVTTAMQPVAFTVTRQADSTVKLTVQLSQLFDPAALQQALAGAGIPAVVRTGADCTPQKGELPEAGEVYRVEQVAPTDGPVPPWVFVIAPEKMPKNSRLYFSFSTTGEGHAQRGKGTFALVADDDPMNCRTVG